MRSKSGSSYCPSESGALQYLRREALGQLLQQVPGLGGPQDFQDLDGPHPRAGTSAAVDVSSK